MLKKEYFESIDFSKNNLFKVSRKIDGRYRNKLHWHTFAEILVCLTEEIPVTVNFKTHMLKCNDIAVIHPGDLHSVPDVPEDTLLIIQFPGELLTVLGEIRSRETLFLQFPHIHYDPLRADSHRMLLLIKEFAETADADLPFREVRMYALLLSFFEQVGQYCLRSQREQARTDTSQECRSTRQMAEACLFITHNCASPLTLEDAAGHMGMSKSHFAHLFKVYTGMTFVDYLTEERIKRAKALFPNPNVRIIDIAFDSGFSSISSFNRAFKKCTGMTPSHYRKTLGIQDV